MKISAIMKNIRLSVHVCCVMLLVLILPIQWIHAQVPVENQVDGQVSIRIESKRLTIKQAQAFVQNKDSIPLMVSLIFKGGWVDRFDKNIKSRMNNSSFSYGIATKSGTTSADAPLYSTGDVPAYMLASRDLKCSVDGISLQVPPEQENTYIVGPDWNAMGCPEYGYGCGFSSSSSMKPVRVTENGETYYVVDLFTICFKLKRLETVYVRGIDNLGTYETDQDGTIPTTPMTTELNIRAVDNSTLNYWPGCPDPSKSADWTMAPADYYGGVIPGGIFIEQVPELTQFEP